MASLPRSFPQSRISVMRSIFSFMVSALVLSLVLEFYVDGGGGNESINHFHRSRRLRVRRKLGMMAEFSDPKNVQSKDYDHREEANLGHIVSAGSTVGTKRTLFYCGRPWKFDHYSLEGRLIARMVFPEYPQTDENPAVLFDDSSIPIATQDDLLVVAMHQFCDLDPDVFPGKVLYINAEYYDIHPHHRLNPGGELTTNYLPENPRAYVLGPHEDTEGRSIRVTYLAMRLSFYPPSSGVREKIFDPTQKPVNTRKHFLLYANSHYVEYREQAAAALSEIAVIHTAGKCQGNINANSVWDGSGPPQCTPFPDHMLENRVQRAPATMNKPYDFHSQHNEDLFRDYRFSLVMENIKVPGYITEKLLLAFLSGTVPIYYGTEDVFDIFNRDAFVYYNVLRPGPALERIAWLEANPQAYEEMLQMPILADGQRTIEKYFSFEDDVGGGELKKRIRAMLGFADESGKEAVEGMVHGSDLTLEDESRQQPITKEEEWGRDSDIPAGEANVVDEVNI